MSLTVPTKGWPYVIGAPMTETVLGDATQRKRSSDSSAGMRCWCTIPYPIPKRWLSDVILLLLVLLLLLLLVEYCDFAKVATALGGGSIPATIDFLAANRNISFYFCLFVPNNLVNYDTLDS